MITQKDVTITTVRVFKCSTTIHGQHLTTQAPTRKQAMARLLVLIEKQDIAHKAAQGTSNAAN